ncbi:uncharacterized protein LOC123548934 [Mercenaria mercenaria]|uniref:uncharacterized protein LOC123548934 n=1 Tax=Mercenaria mercenaria TaxID=6596 RepID=UPI00234F55F9|nr:uncharacterized protein LOC123548934 [Mercenaria mercenaria]
MSEFTQEEYAGSDYRYRKRILVTIFSQPSVPLNTNWTVKKTMVEDNNRGESDVDIAYLEDVFKTIHYPENAEVRVKTRFGKEQIKKYISDLGNPEQYDSFFFVFLTFLSCETKKISSSVNQQQEYQDERIHFKDGPCPLQEIYDEVKKVKAMWMKPKIFLIQADDISLLYPEQFAKGEELVKRVKIPQDADRLIIMSDIPQKVANPLEDDRNQSFLIRAFGETLIENSQAKPEERQDVLSLTTTINGKVDAMIEELKKQDKTNQTNRAADMKVPLVTSTLTKLARI